MKTINDKAVKAQVYCPICTHTVEAGVDVLPKKARVSPGQRCPRCAAALDAGIVLQVMQAA